MNPFTWRKQSENTKVRTAWNDLAKERDAKQISIYTMQNPWQPDQSTQSAHNQRNGPSVLLTCHVSVYRVGQAPSITAPGLTPHQKHTIQKKTRAQRNKVSSEPGREKRISREERRWWDMISAQSRADAARDTFDHPKETKRSNPRTRVTASHSSEPQARVKIPCCGTIWNTQSNRSRDCTLRVYLQVQTSSLYKNKNKYIQIEIIDWLRMSHGIQGKN